MVQKVTDPVESANRMAKEATESRREDERIAKAELKQRKAADIKNIPPIPTCPGISKIGSSLFCDVTKDTGKALAVWGWWRQIATEFPDRITTYITRLHPAGKPKPKGERSEATIYGFPEQWEFADDFGNLESWILQRLGSGNYRFFINDTSLGALLVQWTLNGIWDEKFPPLISPEDVDLEHPNNKSYVEWLRRKNIIAGFEEKPVADNQPNAAAVAQAAVAAAQQANTSGVAGVAAALANTVKELATKPAPPQVDTASIVKDTLAVVLDGVRQSQSVSTAAGDPAAHVKQVIDLAKSMQPPPQQPIDIAGIMKESRAAADAAQARIDKLADEMRESDKQRMRDLERRLEQSLNKPPENPMQTFRDQMAVVKEMKDLFGGGGSGDEEENPKSGKEPWWAEKLMPAVAPLIGLGAQFLATKLQPQAQQPMGAAPQAGIVPVGVNPQQPQQQEPQVNAQEMMLWNAIGAQMQNHYATGKSGIDFALWFVDQPMLGEANYNAIATQFTRDQVIMSMRRYAPLVAAQVLLPDGTPHGQFLKFMDEFLDHAAVMEMLHPPAEPEVTVDAEATPVAQLPRRVRKAN